MSKKLSRLAAAAGIAALSMASSATWAATYTYDFNTFYDTSTTADLYDKATLTYSVAQLNITDIAGGVQISLKQNVNDFSAKNKTGTIVDALWLGEKTTAAVKGTVATVSGDKVTSSSYSFSSPVKKDGSNSYQWSVGFSGLFGPAGIKEGETSTFSIKGTGITADSFAKALYAPMIDLTNVGGKYNTSFLGLGGGNVHFIGRLVPEPSTYALMALGLVGVAFAARRRQA